MSTDANENDLILHALVLAPPEVVMNLEGLPDDVKRDAGSGQWGYRYSGHTLGLGTQFGIRMPSAGYDPGRTPQCGYISINGSPQYLCRLMDFRWASGGGSVMWWFNNFELCA